MNPPPQSILARIDALDYADDEMRQRRCVPQALLEIRAKIDALALQGVPTPLTMSEYLATLEPKTEKTG